ncbi:hypoxanthine phosphoribosyltransferase [Methanocorpusculum vombati]|uniref:hypoxanthine phosphoribosyltransferase n=1 Tax=Methanocorpusculum vombati TaxID=3002864 RepID=A0ABT4IJG9_9EURY|nr:hypoxanthine phosphoribosyltransferase [Methanocorpusculum vombati]MCZ9320147.1 hypoxanthine phosphoribosyltransferase [Methanocorpusculum sp.]MCZ0861883.1 hypoxanthine phosphoribosyltransferase [Methanocorpusculum vombati]MDE2521147.1 hypoxanthine phosphoribosyltransferase [Methanocorpusculum sp.]MDE2534884.1 hypoxanthine phosphoribosyltransferase [Methanocorpusculum sp.]MDE2546250.1 hypoxanthine phosphoribosyltransferase [Methanocorpusculum sp.]
MADTIDVLIPEEKIDARIRELAKQIDTDYAGKSVTLLTTLKGACFFSCELAKRLTVPVFMEYIQAASYEGKTSTGTITMKLDVPVDSVAGKEVIIVEDVIDTGRTLSAVKELIRERRPASLAVCSLLDKHECRIVPFEGEYIGFTIGNDFVVGYGLDWDQKYRNLPYIGIVR